MNTDRSIQLEEKDYNHLTDIDLDMLRETGNIAAGNAMTALGKLLGRTLDMSVTKVHVQNIQQLIYALGNPEEYIAGMLINVYGDLNAMLLLALETESAMKTVNLMLEKNVTCVEEFDEIDFSVLCETGNILAGSYLSALNTFTSLELNVSIPQMSIDMAGAILSYPAIEFARNDNAMLFVETAFRDTNDVLNGTYILIMDNASLNKIIQSLGNLL